MHNEFDAIILGGGAAGLMCAWQAGLRGRRVVVLERSKKVGRKILMSGGGRCNFTNLTVEAEHFLSQNPHFVKSALKQYTQWDFISTVASEGIAYHERDHGQLFCDDKAKDIVNLLLKHCEAVGAEIVLSCDVHSVTQCSVEKVQANNSPQFTVRTSKGAYRAPSVVVATGGLSIPSMEPTPFGYELAKQFGMSIVPIRASLVPYTFSGAMKSMFSRLSGSAVPVSVSTAKKSFHEAMLFTHRGLSGPAVLQISNYWESGLPVTVDLIPSEPMQETLTELKQTHPKSLIRTLLSRWLPKQLVQELESAWWAESAQKPIGEWSNSDLHQLGERVNHWDLLPSGTEGYRTAEVTLGGVDTRQLSSKTMESTVQPGLYFIGEVVDVTGHLGGFNFQWAWSSAYACAQAL